MVREKCHVASTNCISSSVIGYFLQKCTLGVIVYLSSDVSYTNLLLKQSVALISKDISHPYKPIK